jgi:hypothetical protein
MNKKPIKKVNKEGRLIISSAEVVAVAESKLHTEV